MAYDFHGSTDDASFREIHRSENGSGCETGTVLED